MDPKARNEIAEAGAMAPNCPDAAAARAANAASELTACCQPLRPTQQNLGSSRRSCNLQAGNVSATPSDESAAAFASTMAHARLKTLQPSALPAASRAQNRPRSLASARLPQSSAVKLWAQAVAAVTFKLQQALAMKSLQAWPELSPALARGEIATASRQPPSPAQASSAHVSLRSGVNRPINVAGARDSLSSSRRAIRCEFQASAPRACCLRAIKRFPYHSPCRGPN